ncbi:hypothetical protein RHMOL_Rhmol06G0043100 [Rhododendron molle]|uniref:Uncharacterized protein n=1 Tax=Rhododendron molle TaxID=49168 RepID=A0ACC0N8Q6_RHOML|nr:hypothetical protein RHMOL_Rhmol06G0043100 [Rhododendron molle]
MAHEINWCEGRGLIAMMEDLYYETRLLDYELCRGVRSNRKHSIVFEEALKEAAYSPAKQSLTSIAEGFKQNSFARRPGEGIFYDTKVRNSKINARMKKNILSLLFSNVCFTIRINRQASYNQWDELVPLVEAINTNCSYAHGNSEMKSFLCIIKDGYKRPVRLMFLGCCLDLL